MDNKDIVALCKSYGAVKPQEVLLMESIAETEVLPAIIKVKEHYEGGPHPGSADIEYRITQRVGNRVKAMATSNPDLDLTLDIDDPTVTMDAGAYHTSVTFKWDDHRKTYRAENDHTPTPDPTHV